MSHLLKHVKKKHPDALLQFKRKRKIDSPVSPSDETPMTSWPEVDVHIEEDETQNGDKGAEIEPSSDVWSLFTRKDDAVAKCNLCDVELSYEHSITDLTTHRETKHPGVLLKCDPSEIEPTRNESCDAPVEENCTSTPQSPKESSSNEPGDEPPAGTCLESRNLQHEPSDKPAAKTPARNFGMKFKRSANWKYFTLIDKTHAECKICQLRISHGSVSNLRRHIVRKHSCQLLASARNGEQRDEEDAVDSDDDFMWVPQDQSSVFDDEGGSDEEVNKIGKNATDAPESPELRRSKRMKMMQMEDVSMNGNLQSSQDQNSVLENSTAFGGYKRVAPRSYVWKVFTKLKNGSYQCKICGATMSRKSCVSNLLRHLTRAHPSFKSAMQKKLAASRIAMGNSLSGEGESVSPVIQTSVQAEHSDGETVEPPTAGDSSDSEPLPTSDGAKSKTDDGASDSEPHAEPRTAGSVKKKKRKASECEPVAKSGKPKSKERNRKADESQSSCLLSQRFVQAVEEGNRLLVDLQGVVERQGRALDRIASCIEAMSRAQKKDS